MEDIPVPAAETQPPDLRIIPLGKLLAHELHDEQRSYPLIRNLRADGILKNPLIVTPAGSKDDRYVILDGANRAAALDVLGIGHVLVQVVPYSPPHVQLGTWHHVLTHNETCDIQDMFGKLPGLTLTPCDIFRARTLLAARAILAYCLLPDGSVFTLAGGGVDLAQRTRLLCSIVDAYIKCGNLNRVTIDHLPDLLALFPSMTVAIIFPTYDPIEILGLAQTGLRVPPGITRHIIHGRALRVNYPLERLAAETSLEQKNMELAAWIRERFQQRGVRYYAEATYLFDE